MTYKIIKINPGRKPDCWDRNPYAELQMLKNIVKSNKEDKKGNWINTIKQEAQ